MIEPMPRPRWPHMHREITRHGRTVWYVRIGKGPRVRIFADFGSDEFRDEYEAAIAGAPRPARKARQTLKGSLAWLVARWQDSAAWAALSEATRRQRSNILARVIETAGDEPYTAITAKVIRAGRDRRAATPFAARNFIKTMRALFAWAQEAQLVTSNPAADVALPRTRTAGFTPWTLADVDAYRDRWPLGTRERLAMELLLWTGLRRGDAARLGPQHVRDGWATLTAEKTGTPLHVPILPPLVEAIAAGPIGHFAYIAAANGMRMTKESFGNWFRESCNAAGVNASAHGLRKLAATLLAEAGATDKELQAAFGWSSGRMSEIYTRAANAKRLAEMASEKRMGNKSIPAPSAKVRDRGEKQ